MKNSFTRQFLAIICALVILTMTTPAITIAKADSPAIHVSVTDESGTPLPGAYVTLWNHSATPSENMGTLISDESGIVVFSYPEMNARADQLDQHLAVSVYAPGHASAISDWSIIRRTPATKEAGLTVASEKGLSDSNISVGLRQNANVQSDNQPSLSLNASTRLSEYRERLVWYDYTSKQAQLTTLANLHQVGSMSTQFGFENTITNKFGVQVKYENSPSFTTSSNLLKSNTLGSALVWPLPATGNDLVYKHRTCQTYYDYRIEEYYCERYMDRGDGILDWIRVDSYVKVYCHGLSAYPTAAGSGILTVSAPSSLSGIRDFAPLGSTDWITNIHETIDAGFSFSFQDCTVNIGVSHDVQTTEKWKFINESSETTYQGGFSEGQWRLRKKP